MTVPRAADADLRAAITAAMLTSGGIVAYHVAGKAVRDALFLANYDVAYLPRIIVAAAAVSVIVVLFANGFLTRMGPGRVMPGILAVSTGLLLLEWILQWSMPKTVAVLVYLHFAAIGGLLISTFWSLIGERFDPRTAKRVVGKIAGASTLGGVVGGILAERVAAWVGASATLPLLAGANVFCWWAMRGLRPTTTHAVPQPARANAPWTRPRSALEVLAAVPYLRSVIAVALLVTVSEVLIDYVFKARTAAAYWSSADLTRFFAGFYAVVALLTFVVQAVATRFVLQRFGIANSVALLPLAVIGGAGTALIAPGLMAGGFARGLESVLHNSAYRSSYELLFTPLPAAEKRATKAVIDVGFVRLGDVLGGGLVQAVLMMAGFSAAKILLAITVVLAAIAAGVARTLQRGYVQTLERNLISRAVQLDVDDVTDSTTLTTMMQTLGAPEARLSDAAARPKEVSKSETPPGSLPVRASTAVQQDPLLTAITDLRSGVTDRVRHVLGREEGLDAVMVAHVVPLLAWDEVAADVVHALRRATGKAEGQLIDALLDPDQEFAIRRRIPLVLSHHASARVIEGLVSGLDDKRFEVRYRCGRALARIQERRDDLVPDRARVLAAIVNDVTVDRRVWESQRLLDRLGEEDESPMVDEYIRDRASRSLEHVFTLLSLILPRQPLRVAFRGLHATDPHLRGTALEYLESALPAEVREKLWPFLEDDRRRQAGTRPREEILAELLRSNDSIALNLKAIRRASGETPDDERRLKV